MLDRKVVREFLNEELEGIEIPDDIFKESLVETFCKYVEDDYYEQLKDNFKTFLKCQGDGSFDNKKCKTKTEEENVKL